MFNDTFVLKNEAGKEIDINEKGIAWASDVQYKFKNIQNPPDGKSW